MLFHFEERPSTSPYIESIWRNRSDSGGTFLSTAVSHWLMVVTRLAGRTYITMRGPDTRPAPAFCPPDAEHVGVYFKLGVIMPHLPAAALVDGELDLPAASDQKFWLNGSAWQYPDFENIDTFIDRLARQELLVREPVVTSTVETLPDLMAMRRTSFDGEDDLDHTGQPYRPGQLDRPGQPHRPGQPYRPGQIHRPDLSLRSVQRRFLQTTGLTFQAIHQIERARFATTLLKEGWSILDVVELAGYADQPHLTRSLRRYIGQTPAQVAGNVPNAEPLSFLFKTNSI